MSTSAGGDFVFYQVGAEYPHDELPSSAMRVEAHIDASVSTFVLSCDMALAGC